MRNMNLKLEVKSKDGETRLVRARGWKDLFMKLEVYDSFNLSSYGAAVSCCCAANQAGMKARFNTDPLDRITLWRVR